MKRNYFFFGFLILILICYILFETFCLPEPSPSTFLPVYASTTSEKNVYLTFDDGPTDSTTPYVLDVLKKERVPATFFIIGRQAERRPYLLKRVIREGHALGIHSYSHEYKKIYASPDALLLDIEKCRNVIYDVTGISPTLYRFPGGSFDRAPALKHAVTGAGYHYVDWNATSDDAVLLRATPSTLYNRAIKTSEGQNEVILLCHDFANRKATVAALPDIIRYYKEREYTFRTLS